MYVYQHSVFYLSPHSISRYNEAMATIRRIPSIDHNFQLVITRVYEDEDQELLEDEDESEGSFCSPCQSSTYDSGLFPL
jgi:hypothetical protein